MPVRALLVVCVLLVAACGGGPGPGAQGPPSAQSVSQNSSDFTGVQKCPDSGSYDSYLQAEQAKAPTRYATDKKTWDSLKAAGANDSYIAVNADTPSDCDQFGSTNFQGKVAEVFALRFQDSAKAGAAYKTSQGDFHLTDSEVAQLKAFGATVLDGQNSIVVKFAIANVMAYIALWQNKEFEVAIVTYNLPLTAGPAAATKVNARIR